MFGHRQAVLLKDELKKSVLTTLAAVGCIMALVGCGSSAPDNYTILERQEGSAQITYRVQVKAGMPESEVNAIARELEAKGNGKSTMVNFYDGPRSVENMVYTCQGGTCYNARTSSSGTGSTTPAATTTPVPAMHSVEYRVTPYASSDEEAPANVSVTVQVNDEAKMENTSLPWSKSEQVAAGTSVKLYAGDTFSGNCKAEIIVDGEVVSSKDTENAANGQVFLVADVPEG